MISYAALPAVNALLNATSAALLLTGHFFIRHGQIGRHRACMLGAFLASTLFLTSYLIYHAHAGHVSYTGTGIWRTAYFAILISHTLLAMAIVPLVLRTLYLALGNRFLEHRAWARWTFPIWLYVSVTGVVIYEMLY